MNLVYSIARIILGSIFLTFGINGFFVLLPVPEYHPFMEILIDTEYIYVVKGLEMCAGFLLLVNRFIGIALLILGPIILNILLYHLLIDPRNWPIGFANMFFYSLILWDNRALFSPFFKSQSPNETI